MGLENFRHVTGRYKEAFGAAWRHRGKNPVSRRHRGEADFLPAMLEIQESPPHPMARITLYLILTLFSIAVLWMLVGKIDIVTTATGKILPDNRIKVVQAAQGGIVESILVQDGDEVRAGDILLALDSTTSEADETSIAGELGAQRLEAEMTRLLAAESEFSSPPRLSAIAEVAAAKIVLQQQVIDNLFSEQKSRIAQIESDIAALQADLAIEQQGEKDSHMRRDQEEVMTRQKLASERHQIGKLEELLPIAESEYASFGELYKESVVSRIQLQQSQEKYISLKKDLQYKRNQLEEIGLAGESRRMELEQQAMQYRNRVHALRAKIVTRKRALTVEKNRFRREMNERHAQALRQINELEQSLIKARQSERHHQIAAPADGVVQQLAIHTQGAVVQAAQVLMIIVPKERILEIEAFVENKDIGFVSVGQEVQIKVDAFPYTKYGLVAGEVSHLSADAIEDEKRGLIYQAKIKLKEDGLIVNGEKKPLSPGMSVVAEIKTGHRRVIEFFMAPLIQHGKESLNER